MVFGIHRSAFKIVSVSLLFNNKARNHEVPDFGEMWLQTQMRIGINT